MQKPLIGSPVNPVVWLCIKTRIPSWGFLWMVYLVDEKGAAYTIVKLWMRSNGGIKYGLMCVVNLVPLEKKYSLSNFPRIKGTPVLTITVAERYWLGNFRTNRYSAPFPRPSSESGQVDEGDRRFRCTGLAPV